MQTLADLKAENEKESQVVEEKPQEIVKPEAVIVDDTVVIEEKPEEKPETVAETLGESEEWLKPETTEEPEAKFTDSDAAAIRRKWKGKVSEAQSEIEALKKQLDELKQVRTVAPSPLPNEPKSADYETDDEYLKALTDYRINLVLGKQKSESAAAEQQRKLDEQKAKISQSVDGHYLRAHKLAEKSSISAEAYQSADLNVRKAIESVFPGAGDSVADALIASLGDGSEKVFFNLGVNTPRRDKFIELLREDTSGIRAATYLGQLNAQLNTPVKRESNAPAPMEQIQGDKASSNLKVSELKRKYQEAHSRNNNQAAFDIKKQAKKAGINTKDW